MSETKSTSLCLSSQMTGSVVRLSDSARIQDYEYLYASNTNVSSFVPGKLSGSHNYLLWKAQMVWLLDSKNMCGIVDSTFACPRDSGTGITRQYDSLVRGWILGSVTEHVLADVYNLGSAKAVWEKLKSIHDPTTCLQEVKHIKKMEWSILPVRFPDNLWDEVEIDKMKLKVEQSMKNTAESFSITAALITAILFAAGIIAPDASNKELEMLTSEVKTPLFIFVISNAISLFASNTALLVFLSIQTSGFAEKDFSLSLPRRFFIGVFSFFLCTASMMVALGATLFFVFCDQKPWKLVLICGLLFLAIALSIMVQFPLMVDLFTSTYLRLFGKQRKKHVVRDSKLFKNLREVTIEGDWSEVESMLKKERQLPTETISSDGCTVLQLAAETGTELSLTNHHLSASAQIQDIEYLYASNTDVSSFVPVSVPCSSNYLLWKAQMICLLESNNMCGIVVCTFVWPRDSVPDTMRQYDRLVRGWILGSVTGDVLVEVFNLGSVKAVWGKLKSIYDPIMSLQEETETRNEGASPDIDDGSAATKPHGKGASPDIDDVSGATQPLGEGVISIEIIVGEDILPTETGSKYEDTEKSECMISYMEKLHATTIKGDWSEVESMLKNDKGLATDARCSQVQLILHISVGRCYNLLVENLFSCINDEQVLQQRDADGSTPLHIVAIIGNNKEIQFYCSKSCHILQPKSETNNKDTQKSENKIKRKKKLLEVTVKGNWSEVESMLEEEEELTQVTNEDTQNGEINTLLHLATRTGRKMGSSSNPLSSASGRIRDIEYLYASNTGISSFVLSLQKRDVNAKRLGLVRPIVEQPECYVLSRCKVGYISPEDYKNNGSWTFCLELTLETSVMVAMKMIMHAFDNYIEEETVERKSTKHTGTDQPGNAQLRKVKVVNDGSEVDKIGVSTRVMNLLLDGYAAPEYVIAVTRSAKTNTMEIIVVQDQSPPIVVQDHEHVFKMEQKKKLHYVSVKADWSTVKSMIKKDEDQEREAVGIGHNELLKKLFSYINDEHVLTTTGNKHAESPLVKRNSQLLQIDDHKGEEPLQKAYENMHLDTVGFPLKAVNAQCKIECQSSSVGFPHPGAEIGVRLLVNAIAVKQYSLASKLVQNFPKAASKSDELLHTIAKTFPNGASFMLLASIKKTWKQNSKLEYFGTYNPYYTRPTLEVACQNVFEVVYEILIRSPKAIQNTDTNGYATIKRAIIHCSEKMLNFINDIGERKDLYKALDDSSKNNLLPLAGRLSTSNILNQRTRCASLQLQQDLQWRKNFMQEGERWVTSIAKSCSITEALITTLLFTAMITIPGESDQAKGTPLLEVESILKNIKDIVTEAINSEGCGEKLVFGNKNANIKDIVTEAINSEGCGEKLVFGNKNAAAVLVKKSNNLC